VAVKVLLVIALIAVVIYLVIRVIERGGLGRRGPDDGGRPEPRVTGPDDDPDFLRDLDRRRKRRQEHDDS